MKIKINIGKIRYSNFFSDGNFLILAYTIGVIIAHFTGARFVLEAIFLVVAFILVGFYPAMTLMVISLTYALLMSLNDGIASLSLVYYFLLILVVSGNIKFQFPKAGTIYLCFAVLLYFIIIEQLESLLRPSGAFNSPLSASYFIACCILLLSAQKRFLGLGLIAPAILIPGSRAGFLISLFAMKKVSRFFKFILIFIVPILVSLAVYQNLRAVSFHATSDSRRVESWMKIFYLDYSSPINIFMGYGRSQLGSLGQALGTAQTVSVESSFIGLFFSYGTIGCVVFLMLFLSFAYRNSLYWWLFFIICSVSVVMDSLAISVIIIMSLSLLIDPKRVEVKV